MSLTWQNLTRGLPVPPLPDMQGVYSTRYFATGLTLAAQEAQVLHGLLGGLLRVGTTVRLPDGAGALWLCRLAAAPELTMLPDGLWRVQMEFEVVDGQALLTQGVPLAPRMPGIQDIQGGPGQFA